MAAGSNVIDLTWLIATVFCTVLNLGNTYNVDTKAPIIKNGADDSYFGFSVAIHLLTNKVAGDTQPVILVGAPRDNITDPSAIPDVQQLVRPGVVYQCPVTSLRDDCIAVKIDREKPHSEEDKNGQWMGVSVVSQGTEAGMALACAHRFTHSLPRAFRWGLGSCVTLTNSLDIDQIQQPCDGEKMNTDTGGFAYGFCQAGISATVSQDGDYLIGAPGVYNWRGTVFKNKFGTQLLSDNKWFHTPVEDPSPIYKGPRAVVDYYSHLGMTVKIAYIDGQKWYIGGSPRSKERGQVLLFRESGEYLVLDQQRVLTGSQFGSSFGSDIVVADLNGDGKEDLVTSAPFYHARGTGGAVYIYYNAGQGITSLLKPQVIYNRKMKDIECTQLNCHDARFGLALASLGDIDRDGFGDLAVGAPYEGNGAVYIFRGSSRGIIPEYSQRIYASDIYSIPVHSFGASLTGAIDVDKNGYPDLVVGAFSSQTVAVLRSRPVINIRTTMKSIPERIDRKETQCRIDGSSNVCFEIRVCFLFTAEPRNRFNNRLAIDYQLDTEKLSIVKPVRALLPYRDPKTRNMVESPILNGSLLMNEQSKGEFACNTHTVYIVKNNRDFLNPIVILMKYKLKDMGNPSLTPGGDIGDINNYPIINMAAAQANLSVDFAQNCGEDHKCNSSLSVLTSLSLSRDNNSIYLLRIGQNQEMTLTVHVHNSGEEAHQALLTIELPQSVAYLGTVTKESICTPSEETIHCIIGNPLPGGSTVTTSIRLDVSSTTASHEPLHIIVRVNTTSIEANIDDNTDDVAFFVIAETDLAVRGRSDPEQVMFGGVILGESAVEFEDQIGSVLIYNIEVRNKGNITVPSNAARLIVNWPYEFKASSHSDHGKHLLYLMKEPYLYDGGKKYDSCSYDKNTWINPLNIKTTTTNDDDDEIAADAVIDEQEDETVKRKRRQATEYADSDGRSLLQDDDQKEVIKLVTLNCQSDKVKCREMVCHLGELAPGGGIALRMYMRIWNHTFLEEFSDVDRVIINSIAEVRLDPRKNLVQTDRNNDIWQLVTIAVPDKFVQEKVPWWIILVSIIVGVILLSVVIILLWKCGFFKRNRGLDATRHRARFERSEIEYHD